MSDQLWLRLKGPLGDSIKTVRDRLDMTKHGRLDDVFDQEFGRRELRTMNEGRAQLTLWRYDQEDWLIEVTYDGDPLPQDLVNALHQEILAVANETGIAVVAQGPQGTSEQST